MPRSTSGKWVARAGATGGGRTYRGQVPVNWYVALVLIVLLGLGSVVFARTEYQSGAATNTVPPLKGGTPWFAAVDFNVCGTPQTTLPSNALNTTTQSFYTTGRGVIVISPKSTTDAGHNAVLGKFVASYHDLALTTTSLTLPGSVKPTTATSKTKTSKTSKTKKTKKSTNTSTGPRTFRNGEKCPAGTKDAGKAGYVQVSYWKNAFSSKNSPVSYTGDPATLPFSNDQLITIGFVPKGTKLAKPNGAIVTALLNASTSHSTTSTTVPTSAPPTSAPTTPTTTASASTSTTSPTPTTTSTTTTSPSGK